MAVKPRAAYSGQNLKKAVITGMTPMRPTQRTGPCNRTKGLTSASPKDEPVAIVLLR